MESGRKRNAILLDADDTIHRMAFCSFLWRRGSLSAIRRSTLIIILFLGFWNQAQIVEPVIDTSFTFGGENFDQLEVIREVTDRRVLMAGTSVSDPSGDVTDINNGNEDYWVIKQDTAILFSQVFDKTYGGDSIDILGDMEILADDGFILAGSSMSSISTDKSENNLGDFDYWVIRCDVDGNIVWENTIGGDSVDVCNDVLVLNDGYLLSGYSASNSGDDKSEDSKGEKDFWIVKLGLTGNVLWERTIGGDQDDIAWDAMEWDGGYLILGESASDTSGDKTTLNQGGVDFWLVQLDDTGALMWELTYGGTLDDWGREIIKPNNGNITLLGTSESAANGNKTVGNFGGTDCWTISVDSAGNSLYQNGYGGSGDEVLYDVLSPPESGLIIGATSNSGASGNKTSGNKGSTDYWIYKVDSAGNKLWDYDYGGDSRDDFRSIYQGCDRGLLIAGFSRSDISGDKEQDSRGADDYWYLRTLLPTRPLFQFDNVCDGTAVNFYDESDIWPDSWLWNFGDPASGSNTSVDQHPIHQYSGPGDYAVTLFVQEGCQQDTFYVDTITIYENPILGLMNLGEDQELCLGETTTINAPEMPSGTTFLWNTGSTAQSIFVDEPGVFSCSVQNGYCTEDDEIEIHPCPNFYIPNAFSPNDDGINDVFYIVGEGIQEMDLFIYNRWGQQIFHGTEISQGWDGKVNGNPVQIDVYVYVLVYRGLAPVFSQKVGHLSVVR